MKAFSRMNDGELNNAVDEKKALPDMVLKRHIFDAQRAMVDAHSTLMYNRSRNGNVVNDNDLYLLKSKIVSLFGMIGEMARENGYYNLNDVTTNFKSDYEFMQDLLYLRRLSKYRDKEIDIVIRLVQYNLNILHRLNLTNLLIDIEADESSIELY